MPPKRPRNLRRANKDTADWEDNDIPDSNATTHIESSAGGDKDDPPNAVGLDDLLEFQKFRRQRQRGLDIGALAKGERKKNQTSKSRESKDSSEHIDDDDEGEGSGRPEGLSTTRSLSGAFTVQSNKLDANKHMMEYIETEMGKHRGVPDSTVVGTGTTDDVDESRRLPADDLYQVPKHLRIVNERPVSEGNIAMASKMLTSIQEVDLGAESKARNARATNMVVSELSHTPGSSTANPLPSSNTRYQKVSDPSDRSSKATDDAVLQRFKKRMRR
ncbi:hypothetical protein GGI09_005694 [Coemansia sp. S100]|nr:hypothetical protein LPJ71_003827 [Coemansia sp. S17]KAJ2084536.1 hypothetical protein GGI16_007090 [Coemansia sp. S142-1]KAJ2093909.1 hypothetical protein GGI09_005694 [Coemansia sp. S100]